MNCPTHAHHKWDCPKSNGRHDWEWDWESIRKYMAITGPFLGKIGIPIHCIYGCGAYGIELYEFKEIIEGEQTETEENRVGNYVGEITIISITKDCENRYTF